MSRSCLAIFLYSFNLSKFQIYISSSLICVTPREGEDPDHAIQDISREIFTIEIVQRTIIT